MESTSPQTGFASVNGLEMYYEIHGSGEPLVLIHGGVVGIPMLTPILPSLSQSRSVIAVELQGHGRTADIDRPLSYESLADDVAGLLDELRIASTDVMGYSLGGGVALQLVIRHPQNVRRLALVSTTFRRDGWYREVLADFDQMGPASAEPLKQSPLSQMFPTVNWEVLFTKIGALQRQDYDWSEEIAGLSAQTLLVFADADAIRPKHMIEFFGLLGGGKRDAVMDGSGRTKNQLAILPGQTHYNVLSSPSLAGIVNGFLDAQSL